MVFSSTPINGENIFPNDPLCTGLKREKPLRKLDCERGGGVLTYEGARLCIACVSRSTNHYAL